MKHFQKILTYLIVFIISFAFIQTDLLSQNDSLVNKDSLIIGGVYKVTLISNEEVLGEMQGSDSASIILLSHEDIVNVDKAKIKSIEKLKYLLQFDTDKEVTVTTNSGTLYKGDLLSVTDYNLSLTRNDELDNQSSIRLKNNVRDAEKDNIKRILIHGDSKVLIGFGSGASLGLCIGLMMGGSQDDNIAFSSQKMVGIGGIVGTIIGGVIGLCVGLATSTPDEIIEINSDDDFYRLNKYAKYSFGELPIHKNQKKKNNK